MERKRGQTESDLKLDVEEAELSTTEKLEAKRREREQAGKELVEKRKALEEIESGSPGNYKDLKNQSESAERLLFEAGVLEEKIKTLDAEIQGLELEEKRQRRAAILKEAGALTEEIESHFKGLREILNRALDLTNVFQENNPSRRVRTGASRTVKIERTVRDARVAGFGFHGEPVIDKSDKREETEIPATPEQIEHAESLGWKVMPGQLPLRKEPLDDTNSTLEMAGLPAIFDSFAKLRFVLRIIDGKQQP